MNNIKKIIYDKHIKSEFNIMLNKYNLVLWMKLIYSELILIRYTNAKLILILTFKLFVKSK